MFNEISERSFEIYAKEIWKLLKDFPKGVTEWFSKDNASEIPKGIARGQAKELLKKFSKKLWSKFPKKCLRNCRRQSEKMQKNPNKFLKKKTKVFAWDILKAIAGAIPEENFKASS